MQDEIVRKFFVQFQHKTVYFRRSGKLLVHYEML